MEIVIVYNEGFEVGERFELVSEFEEVVAYIEMENVLGVSDLVFFIVLREKLFIYFLTSFCYCSRLWRFLSTKKSWLLWFIFLQVGLIIK